MKRAPSFNSKFICETLKQHSHISCNLSSTDIFRFIKRNLFKRIKKLHLTM